MAHAEIDLQSDFTMRAPEGFLRTLMVTSVATIFTSHFGL
jgi:hypothetical protein